MSIARDQAAVSNYQGSLGLCSIESNRRRLNYEDRVIVDTGYTGADTRSSRYAGAGKMM
jgi:hypothetical protein